MPAEQTTETIDLRGAGLRQTEFRGGFRLPDNPTDTEPGSQERIAVLQERARQRVRLDHPQDRQEHRGVAPAVVELRVALLELFGVRVF